MTKEKKKGGPKGFAAISPERRRELSSMGGKASQANGKGHRLNSETAKAARAKVGKVKRDE